MAFTLEQLIDYASVAGASDVHLACGLPPKLRIDGSLKKIASNAYVITPSNVDVGDAQLRAGNRAQAPKEEEKEDRSFGEL